MATLIVKYLPDGPEDATPWAVIDQDDGGEYDYYGSRAEALKEIARIERELAIEEGRDLISEALCEMTDRKDEAEKIQAIREILGV